jgi:hypothetical protein
MPEGTFTKHEMVNHMAKERTASNRSSACSSAASSAPHHVSAAHLQRQQVGGKRLTYRRTDKASGVLN